MKSLSGKLGVIILSLSFFAVGCQIPVKKDEYSKGADWRCYAVQYNDELYFYDAASLTSPPQNIIRLWTKVIYREASKKEYITMKGNTFIDLYYGLMFVELHCKERKMGFLQIGYYTQDGTELDFIRYPDPPEEWLFYKPGKIGDILHKAVCK